LLASLKALVPEVRECFGPPRRGRKKGPSWSDEVMALKSYQLIEPAVPLCLPRSRLVLMADLIRIFTERGDLAHLALLLWATSASALAWFVLRELAAASRRFDDFVRELVRFNELFGDH
jgi:hypothetical protein